MTIVGRFSPCFMPLGMYSQPTSFLPTLVKVMSCRLKLSAAAAICEITRLAANTNNASPRLVGIIFPLLVACLNFKMTTAVRLAHPSGRSPIGKRTPETYDGIALFIKAKNDAEGSLAGPMDLSNQAAMPGPAKHQPHLVGGQFVI